ncbi:ABC transporter ATP-binding protein [Leptolyngbyaceae cyanobacterium CCMR0082]|uniref:ABC transporter ATP-binding protein n=2 Tax=Adonisia turfae TaxID=2950184 RepID=A0A6M0S5D1_9CYAN|nr:ABC transporter ATP-binding protein [Adonisia turfae]NEZ54622.1 ABC transporter ATP-binding protein [Adonisia turfae CCMR0081]NEZ63181.1 ABC transporter ATP-binding protein [Adonisia turfae CCMR0082]
MADNISISLENVSKVFKRYQRPADRLKEILLPGKTYAKEFWALRDISLEILRGETWGIIGRNGAGKSTLLKIIAGTLQPTSGIVQVNGRVSALLELGSGFNPEFTGRQNVFFNGRLLGLSQVEIEERFEEIAAFADIGNFIDQPVKTYSSGMFVRLAFAVAINVNPDVLIIDEALAVGDGIFVHKCIGKVKSFQDSGGTILFVSHDTGSVNRLCSNCVWLKDGHVAEIGLPVNVSKSYQAWTYEQINTELEKNQLNSKHIKQPSNESKRIDKLDGKEIHKDIDLDHKQSASTSPVLNSYTQKEYMSFPASDRCGTGRCEITQIRLLGKGGSETNFFMPGDKFSIIIECVAHDRVESPIVGVQMFDRLRAPMIGWNTAQYGCKLNPLHIGETVRVSFTMNWPHIKSDNYALEPAVADGDQENHEMLDWLFTPLTFRSGEKGLTFGFLRMEDVNVICKLNSEKPIVRK